jgi:ABC-type transport system substrate-binding protein
MGWERSYRQRRRSNSMPLAPRFLRAPNREHDVRTRRAATLAIDRESINQAITFGYSKLTNNAFVPPHFEFYWQPPEPVYDIAVARRLLAEAGHAGGIDAGAFYCDACRAQKSVLSGTSCGVLIDVMEAAKARYCDDLCSLGASMRRKWQRRAGRTLPN